MSRTWTVPSPTRFGASEFHDRLARCRLQALSPIICFDALNSSIYGLVAFRASSLGIEHQELERWWEHYKARGMQGLVPITVQPKWHTDVAELETRLAEERQNWSPENAQAFDAAVRSALASTERGKIHVPPEAAKAYAAWKLSDVQEAHRPRYKGSTAEQTADQLLRIGKCREILLEPVLKGGYTDAAIESYARDWGVSGSTIRRTWLPDYDPRIGASSAAPQRLTGDLVAWLAMYERPILALRGHDTRPLKPYWRSLTGAAAAGTAAGVATKHLTGPEAEALIVRYTAAKIAVAIFLCLPRNRRTLGTMALAKALGVSDQTLANWKTAYENKESMRPRIFTESMAAALPGMEAVVLRLPEFTRAVEDEPPLAA